MTRILIQYLLPLLLPTLLFFAWSLFARRRRAAHAPEAGARETPWLWLAIAGVVLLGASLVTVALTSGSDPAGTYQSPRYEDGRIVPGRVK